MTCGTKTMPTGSTQDKSNPTGKEEIMLEFFRDGRSVACKPIHNRGHVGQMVVLDRVSFGNDSDPAKYPLSQYPQPYAFIIVEKVEGKSGYYVIKDSEGNRVKLQDDFYGASIAYLYDMHEWLAWQKEFTKERMAQKDRIIEKLKDHLELLKGILVKQGYRLVSEEDARQLGLK